MISKNGHSRLRKWGTNQSGATALEFAIVVPVFLMLTLAAIDLALLSYRLNQAQAAARIGARIAIVSPIIATNMAEFDTSGYAPGTSIPVADIPAQVCGGRSDGAFECSSGPADTTTANLVLDRIRQVLPDADASNLQITYTYTGLGVVGNPIGMDFEPLTTVGIVSLKYVPVSSRLFGSPTVNLPVRTVTLTGEDLS
jgi:Flp pilus assembly protein TadG